ncbi:MFS transporter [Nocardia sp. NPDC049707]|uniref:MFS transporter n=1 Tax=Nocardia sp. NPDC049707 TaxID=3154735 RepID=UPI003449D60C
MSTTLPARTTTREWLAVALVALGIFTMVTVEMLPVGLLTPMTGQLNVTIGTGGLMVTIPGVVAAIAAPLVIGGAGRLDRRILLCGLMSTLALANLISAVAPNFPVLLTARALAGVCIGGFWSVAGSLAVRLVRAESVPRATSLIFGGVATASVLGVPLGTQLGQIAGWRWAFAAGAVLAGLVLAGMVSTLPTLPSTASSLRSLPNLVRTNLGIRCGLFVTGCVVVGHFTAYTFVRPILTDVAGIAPGLIGALLLGYGVAGITGNFIAGARVARRTFATMAAIAIGLAVVLLAIPLLGNGPAGGVGILLLWGLAYGGVSVSTQTWIMRAAPNAAEAATALNVSIFNLSIALGAAAGGFIVGTTSLTTTAWFGGILVVLAVPVAYVGRKSVA